MSRPGGSEAHEVQLMRTEDFTKTKAYIFAECAKFVGYLTVDELIRVYEIILKIVESEPEENEDKRID